MSKKVNWLNRTFEFDFPFSRYPEFLKILRDTPIQLETLVNDIPEKLLTRRDEDKWSIQENVGHLLTAESLFIGRLDDYKNNKATLRPADVSGKRTNQANHNSKNINQILLEFKNTRESYLKELNDLDSTEFDKTAFHPRLKKPMRLCDMLHFQAEHDLYHLGRIEELKQKWQDAQLASSKYCVKGLFMGS